MRRLAAQEDGFALAFALLVCVVLTISTISVVTFTSSDDHSAGLSTARVLARSYADAALSAAASRIVQANASGQNAVAANLLGCSGVSGPSDTTAPSDCSSPSPIRLCLTNHGCTATTGGYATFYGFYSGTNDQTFLGRTVPKSTWLLVSTGYARNPNASTLASQTAMATVSVSSANGQAVAAVWNHVFITSPLVPNQCSLTFGGNSVQITVPLYVVGNVCLGSGGNGATVYESTQPVDLEVGGKLVLQGGSKVGSDSGHPITSGVVNGGCTTVSVASNTAPCGNGAFSYWVRSADTWTSNDAPAKTTAEMQSDWATFDPGPKHPCASGGTLASSVFDNDTASNLADEPNASGSSFELTPTNSDYTCVSQGGAGVGQLAWDHSTRTLTINGSIFFDGNITISNSATYTGTAVIEAAGTITFSGNGTSVCAENPCSTLASAWQGASGNNSMLTLVSLAAKKTAITFSNNSQTFQGSLWTQPSSTMTFVKNGVTIEGPLSIGSFDASFNNASFIPLPAIRNMPVGAPLPPNIGVTLGPLTIAQ